jgi:hypothetical protein
MNKIIVCVDDKLGMMFNKRRQSKDQVVINKIKEITETKLLYVSEYTSKIIPEGIVTSTFDKVDGFCFIEDPDLIPSNFDTVYIFRWNRLYPRDKIFNIDLSKFNLISTEEFKGYSHDNITLDVYVKQEV